MRGQVHHTPYPLKRATIRAMTESLVRAAGIERTDAPMSVLYSEGVDVEVFPLTRVA